MTKERRMGFLSQEGLKLIACLTMLLDHSAAVLVSDYELYIWLRGIGRIAFPIYCWLLAEGSHYTRSPGKYALRLAVGMVLSEIPFDFALFGGPTWQHQSVMVTLLLGFGALRLMARCRHFLLKAAAAVPFLFLAEIFCTDYGAYGVLLIAGLALARPYGLLPQTAVTALCCALMPSMEIPLLGMPVSIELFGVLSMAVIALCSGRKATASKAVQWAFYLFYPVHLAILAFIAA